MMEIKLNGSNSPYISVIIPVFNRRHELGRALTSLVNQSFSQFEVIVCDDGSTDDIRGVISKYKDLLNIKYIRIENSGGPARPRNMAVDSSRGKWISFLDSDDWWDPDRLLIVSEYLSKDEHIFYHSLKVSSDQFNNSVREKRKVIGEEMLHPFLERMAIFGNPIPTSSVIIKKSTYLEHGGMCEDRDLSGVEDFDLWLTLAERGMVFIYIPHCLGSYWVGEDALSNYSKKQIRAQKLLYLRHRDKFMSRYIDQANSRQCYVIGSLYLKMGHPKKAAINFLKAKNLTTVSLKLKRLLRLIQSLALIVKKKQ